MKDRDSKNFAHEIEISDSDVLEAMREIEGYIDITPGDFREIYRITYRRAVERIMRAVKARDIMTEKVISVSIDTPVAETAHIMAQNVISGVPVMDGAKVVGVISEKDFLIHMGAQSTDSFMGVVAECLRGTGCVAAPIRAQKAKDIMSSPAITVSEDASVMDIAGIFTEKKINRVPVIDKEGSLKGLVARADIVRASLIHKKS